MFSASEGHLHHLNISYAGFNLRGTNENPKVKKDLLLTFHVCAIFIFFLFCPEYKVQNNDSNDDEECLVFQFE